MLVPGLWHDWARSFALTLGMDSNDNSRPIKAGRDDLQRLRDRTDELELIISSLTIFALYSLPGWLFNSYSGVFTHLSTAMTIAGTVGIGLLTGFCYGMACCFVVHLMTRGYWVGLIGLRTVFPAGINWSKTPGMGPLTRERQRLRLPDLDTVIERTDRLASSLFAVISLLTLSVIWFGTILMVTLVVAGEIGGRFGLTNAGIGAGTIGMIVVFAGLPALLWTLDAVLAVRIPRLQQSRSFLAIVGGLGRIVGFVYPQRLILPVQLTLQSNTRPVIFYLALVISITALVAVGNLRFLGWRTFTLSNEFTYLDDSHVADGFRSPYYEDMASAKDRIRAWPRVSSFSQTGSFVTLFLPYQPLRDNLILDQLCAEKELTGHVCLRQLWSVDIGQISVPMDGFKAAERMDLNMRGLIGVVPLSGLEPGLHTISVIWNPSAVAGDAPVDDRYVQINRAFEIPIVFAPGYELSVGSELESQ